MNRLHHLIDVMNGTTFNPAGLNIVWPKNVGFIFVSDGSLLSMSWDANLPSTQLEIEYYVCRFFSSPVLFYRLNRHGLDSDLDPSSPSGGAVYDFHEVCV